MKNKANALSGTRREKGYQRNWMKVAAETIGAVAAVLAATFAGSASAQDESARALAERSSIVVAGTVTKAEASLEPLQAPSERTVACTLARRLLVTRRDEPQRSFSAGLRQRSKPAPKRCSSAIRVLSANR